MYLYTSESNRPGFDSQVCYLISMQCYPYYLSPLSFFFIYNMQIIIPKLNKVKLPTLYSKGVKCCWFHMVRPVPVSQDWAQDAGWVHVYLAVTDLLSHMTGNPTQDDVRTNGSARVSWQFRNGVKFKHGRIQGFRWCSGFSLACFSPLFHSLSLSPSLSEFFFLSCPLSVSVDLAILGGQDEQW